MKAKRRLLIAGIVMGALLTLAPVFGLLGTVFGMMRAFDTLGNQGVADPQALSASIGDTLISTVAVLFLRPVGIVLLTLSLVCFFRLRRPIPPPLP